MSRTLTAEPKSSRARRWKIAVVFALLAQSALADTVYVGKVAGQDVVTNGLLAFAYLRIGHALDLQKRGPNLYAECPSDNSRNWECEEPSGWWELRTPGRADHGHLDQDAWRDGPADRIAGDAAHL